MAGGMVRPILAPVDAVAEVWRERIKDRIVRTGQRVERKRELSDREQQPVSERTAVNALAAAALTDDEVVQEYLAGVIAAASPSDDNAHLLALIGRLSPIQLRLHYDLYRSMFGCVRHYVERADSHPDSTLESRWNVRYVVNDCRFIAQLDDHIYQSSTSLHQSVRQLRREELLDVTSELGSRVTYKTTRFGLYFFTAAIGLPDMPSPDLNLVVGESETLELDPPVLTSPVMPYPVYEELVPVGQRHLFGEDNFRDLVAEEPHWTWERLASLMRAERAERRQLREASSGGEKASED